MRRLQAGSQRMARKTRDEAELTRQRILKAGLSVIVRDGYEAATLEAIAREACVSRGAVYWHHNGKAMLIEQILNEYSTPLEAYLEAPETLSSGLSHLRRALMETANRQEFMLVTKALLMCKWEPRIDQRNKQIQDRLNSKLCHMLEDAQNKGELDNSLNTEQAAKWLQCALLGLFSYGLEQHSFTELLDSTLMLFLLWIRGANTLGNPDSSTLRSNP